MRALLALAATAALAGCAGYGDPYAVNQPYGTYPATTVYQGGPVYGQYGQYGAYPSYPVYQGQQQVYPNYQGYPMQGYPTPTPTLRDPDGDGVPNRLDAYPDDYRRR